MQEYVMEMLECPACHGELDWSITEERGGRIETGQATCKKCEETYLIQEGIGLFLTSDLPRQDLWEQVDSQLTQHLRENPDDERQLMNQPLEALNPADQYFRSTALEAREQWAEAKIAANTAKQGLYTPETIACEESQFACVVELSGQGEGPIVDLACGQGALVEALARNVGRPIIATDFSPRVLRRNRKWLAFHEIDTQVSLLSFDARRTPFKDGIVNTLTTNQGLPNIEQPGELLKELRRIGKQFLGISHFYPPDDETNVSILKQFGVDELMMREPAIAAFATAGWKLDVTNSCKAKAKPTPVSDILDGATIDTIPAADTVLEWCALVAN